MKLDSTNKRN